MENFEASNCKRTVLHATDAFEIATCDWKTSDTAITLGHAWGLCSILVQEGRFESHLDLGLRTDMRIFEAGQTLMVPGGAQHTLRCLSDKGRTLHTHAVKIGTTIYEVPRKKFSTPLLGELKEKLDLKLGSEATSWSDLEKNLRDISNHSVSTASPYFMNQLFSGVLPETLISEAVIQQHRTTLATFEASPAFTAVELEVIDRLGELVGWKQDRRDGVGLPGGSAANFMAIHCARHKKVPQFRTRGSQGEKFKIFVSKSAHYSLSKACLATGLGTDALIAIATDADGKMKPDLLKQEIEAAKNRGEIPLLVCATAGTTVVGAFDPVDAIADICEKFSIWFHVDAAWGGPVLFSSTARTLMSGVQRADSVTFDAHKLFGSRLTSSFFLNRHPGLLLEANDSGGEDYLFHSESTELDRGRRSWQCGRGADALSFWSLWKVHGTSGLGDFVDRLFSVRDESVAWIKNQPGLELVSEPAYLNICVRLKSADENAAIKARDAMKADDFAFVNFSTDSKGSYLRLILAHPRVDLHVIKAILTRALASIE